MPRIYYREENLYGQPFESGKINLNVFDVILQKSKHLQNDSQRIITLPQKQTFALFKRNPLAFKHVSIWNETKKHPTIEYGSFFMPETIVFYDNKDGYFPSIYYFIAKINQQLDICQSRSGLTLPGFNNPNCIVNLPTKRLLSVSKNLSKNFWIFLNKTDIKSI